MNAPLKKNVPESLKRMLRPLINARAYQQGRHYARDWRQPPLEPLAELPGQSDQSPNPLWEYFCNHTEGKGIWKREHYFDVYQRHFSRFIGLPVNVLEVGVFSGGSLEMWRAYFGDRCHIYGVDIQPSCKAYENEYTTVFIGDQEDPKFWARFKTQVPAIDILIDDGGHMPGMQQVTLEQMLPHLRPGGVYLCEDLHGHQHRFTSFLFGLVSELNRMEIDPKSSGAIPSPFQRSCYSIHFYPYLAVIEKQIAPPERLSPLKRGTVW